MEAPEPLLDLPDKYERCTAGNRAKLREWIPWAAADLDRLMRGGVGKFRVDKVWALGSGRLYLMNWSEQHMASAQLTLSLYGALFKTVPCSRFKTGQTKHAP